MINFNLLPKKDAERIRVVRQRNTAAAIVVAVVVGLVFLYIGQLSRVALAENRLADERDTLAALEAEVAALGPYQELKDERRMSLDLIEAVLGNEISVADVIDSIGAATTRNTWYSDWTLAIHPEVERPLGSEVTTLGRLVLSGTDVQQSAPGVRGLADQLNNVEGLANALVTSTTQVAEDTYTNQTGDEVTFQVELDLTEERRTGRYANGLPDELAVIVAPSDDADEVSAPSEEDGQ